MNKIIYVDVQQMDGNLETFAIIDRGNDEFTSMPKAIYDAQAKELTESLTSDSTGNK